MTEPLVLGIVGLYLAGMLGLGAWAARRRVRDADDYLVAGRRLNWLLLAATLAATEVGGGSSMGVVRKAFGEWGLGAAWYVWTMALTFVVFALVAPALTRTRCRTIPEYFARRYGRACSAVVGGLMIAALVGLTAVQLVASGLVIGIMTGLDFIPAAVIAGVVVVIYTYLGGMWSVSLTDFVQWICIVVGMAAAVPFALRGAGGLDQVLGDLPPGATALLGKIGLGEVLSLAAIYTTSFLVGQETMQRLYSARSERQARIGSLTTAGFYLLYGLLPTALGLIALSLVRQGIVPAAELQRLGDDALLPLVAAKTLPPALTGVLFAGLISATMSSADSNLLGAASVWANDLAPLLRRRPQDPERIMRSTRSTVLVIGLAATVVAALNVKDLIGVLKLSFSLRAAGPFFPFLLGHYWRRGSSVGALAALLGATTLLLALKLAGIQPWGADPVLAGLLAGGLLYLGGSLIWPDAQPRPRDPPE